MISTTAFFDYVDRTQHGSSYPAISDKEVKAYDIPIPPLPIQNEIVKLLDSFTELTAELVLRKKQYNFYRDSLLNFVRVGDTLVQSDRQTALGIGKIGLLKQSVEVEWRELLEITRSVSSGKNKTRTPDGEYPVYGSTGIIGRCSESMYEGARILVARVGMAAGFVQIVTGKYDVSDNTLIVDVMNDVDMKYIFYYLVYVNLNQLARGGGQPLITAGQLKSIKIPIPPLEVQQKIVSILDRFEALCNDLTQGLPAEIAARKKQYEYYREKLLTFPRKGTSARGAR